MNQVDPENQTPEVFPNPFQADKGIQKIPFRLRIGLVLGGVLGLVLLSFACRLTPNPNGFGTHQDLGFPPCTFIEFFEIPCPSCGMTTSWSHLVRGNLYLAFRSNAGGALLGLATLILAPWFLMSGLLGRWWITPPNMVAGFFTLLGITIVTIVQWLIWITFFPL